jgi:hypothetical protein
MNELSQNTVAPLDEEDMDYEEERTCPYCREVGDECWCGGAVPRCPVCGDVGWYGEPSIEGFSCSHILGGKDDNDFYCATLKIEALPVLPNEYDDVEWSPAQLEQAFGDVLPLIEAYQEWFISQPDAEEFMEALRQVVPDIETDYTTLQQGGAMIGNDMVLYYTRTPEETRQRINTVIDGLRAGFEKLRTSHPLSKPSA